MMKILILKIYKLYKQKINKIKGLQITDVPKYANNNHWMYPLQIDKNIYGKDKEELMKFLSEYNIQTRPIWFLNHLQKPYRNCAVYKINNAKKLNDSSLCF